MEFIVIASRFMKQPERERIVIEAVIEAAEAIGANRIVKRRGNVYSTGVYITDGEDKTMVYNDWNRNWDCKKIYKDIMASIPFSPVFQQNKSVNSEWEIVLWAK